MAVRKLGRVDATSAARLFAAIDAAAEANRFSGAVSLQLGPDLVFERAYGYADRSNRIENTMQTRFGTASVTKGFTALSVCRALQDARLPLETPVRDVLGPLLPHLSGDVTIKHLLTHTSGIGDYYDEEVVTDFTNYHVSIPWHRLERPRDYLPLLDLPPKFAPGERFSYCNSGFIVLGLVVEELGGRPYHDFVQTQIFDRAGMTCSGFFRLDALPGSTALGYIDLDGSWKTNVYNLPVIGGPDGGAFTTAADMAHFWAALHRSLLVGPEWRDAYLRPHVRAEAVGAHVSYGLGVWIYDRPGERLFHYLDGGDAGVSFTSLHSAERGVEYTVACNAPPSAREIVTLLDEAILGLDRG
jgi:CubicO group peptidase (beta-lactamase class C family)